MILSFRSGSARRRQRVPASLDTRGSDGVGDDLDQTLGANIARSAVANPIVGREARSRLGNLAVEIIAKAEGSRRVRFDFDHERWIRFAAFQKIRLRIPDGCDLTRNALEGDTRKRGASVEIHQR